MEIAFISELTVLMDVFVVVRAVARFLIHMPRDLSNRPDVMGHKKEGCGGSSKFHPSLFLPGLCRSYTVSCL
jgi:hypothetical protein